jgi:hypothetical protein
MKNIFKTEKILILIVAVLTAGISTAEVNSVQVVSRLDPNAILITETDIVFVYDEELAAYFPADKTAWYSNKRNFTRAAGDKLEVVNIFIPQGFDSARASLPQRRADAIKVFVFAQHDDSKAKPVDITDFEQVLIEIDPFGIRVGRAD